MALLPVATALATPLTLLLSAMACVLLAVLTSLLTATLALVAPSLVGFRRLLLFAVSGLPVAPEPVLVFGLLRAPLVAALGLATVGLATALLATPAALLASLASLASLAALATLLTALPAVPTALLALLALLSLATASLALLVSSPAHPSLVLALSVSGLLSAWAPLLTTLGLLTALLLSSSPLLAAALVLLATTAALAATLVLALPALLAVLALLAALAALTLHALSAVLALPIRLGPLGRAGVAARLLCLWPLRATPLTLVLLPVSLGFAPAPLLAELVLARRRTLAALAASQVAFVLLMSLRPAVLAALVGLTAAPVLVPAADAGGGLSARGLSLHVPPATLLATLLLTVLVGRFVPADAATSLLIVLLVASVAIRIVTMAHEL